LKLLGGWKWERDLSALFFHCQAMREAHLKNEVAPV